jgi:RNA polymerase sigma-70 factor (ECF subfamily)
MARNSHFDYCRQQKKTSAQFKPLADHHDAVSENEGHSESDFERLELALLELQPEQRELIMLSRYSGMKYEELSKIYGKPVLAIRVQLHRAIKRLKKIYFNQLQEEKL